MLRALRRAETLVAAASDKPSIMTAREAMSECQAIVEYLVEQEGEAWPYHDREILGDVRERIYRLNGELHAKMIAAPRKKR